MQDWKASLPKPDWQHDDVLLYCGDCIAVMKRFAVGCADTAVTDPPYNVGIDYGPCSNDSLSRDDYEQWCGEWFSILKLVADRIAMTCGHGFGLNIPMWCRLCQPDWIYVWRRYGSASPAGRAAMRIGWEPMLSWGFPLKPLGVDVLDYAIAPKCGDGAGSHPTAKPPGLWRLLVDRWTPQNGVVVDPFMGSGQTGVAAIQTGRRFVGIEIEPKHFELAVSRITEAVEDDKCKFEFAKGKHKAEQASLLN